MGSDQTIEQLLKQRPAFNHLLSTQFDFFVMKTFQQLKQSTPLERNWLIGTMAWHLNEVYLGKQRRLIINVPPRHLKSICASVAFPAFVLGNNPSKTFILATYSYDLGKKMMRDLRSVMESNWYRQVFPNTELRKNTEAEFTTSKHGGVNMTSVNGTLTGRGADFIIVDDPIKAAEIQSTAERNRANEWFQSTLFTRLDDKQKGSIILAMQRLHEDDVTGYLTDDTTHKWTILKVPAIATEDQSYPILNRGNFCTFNRKVGSVISHKRENLETVQRTRQEIGSLNFEAQYQQEPISHDGNLVQLNWFKSYTSCEKREHFDAVVASWDTASASGANNDYTVGTIWGIKDKYYYLLDLYRLKATYPGIKARITETQRLWNVNVTLLEKADSGRNLYADLRRIGESQYRAITPRGSKEDRLAACSALIEEGRVFLPDEADWKSTLIHELLSFPNTRYDDQVDSVTLFLNYMRNSRNQHRFSGHRGRPIRERRQFVNRR
ncbi:phage terminase large subunit [Ahrensia marina]|uniref:phage terminase large subunit n=1 Tax=Ahrensia marina TaxID=1514904 RepID=UPI0006B578AF|nr:phage terminase large subunit [Ahrensia marina]